MAARRRPGLSLLGGCTQVGSLCGSPATRRAAWCGRDRGPSCAFVAGDTSNRRSFGRRPKSRRRCAAFGHANPFEWNSMRAKRAGARCEYLPDSVPRSEYRRPGAELMIFPIWQREHLGHSSGTRARARRPRQPPECRTEFFEAVRCLLPRRWAAPGVPPCLWSPWRSSASSSLARAARTPLGGKPRRRHPDPLLRVTSLHVRTNACRQSIMGLFAPRRSEHAFSPRAADLLWTPSTVPVTTTSSPRISGAGQGFG